MTDQQSLPHVRCARAETHPPHRHVNEAPRGGCGLPEWCDGLVHPDTDTRCPHHTLAGQCLDHQGHLGDHQHPQETR